MIAAALIVALIVALYAWQDGVQRCPDGDRYTSGKAQPAPFNRRFCSWPPRLLMVVTWVSLVALAAMLGGWKQSLLFATLPGVWFCAVHPTTVDAPAMLVAWLGASVAPTHPALSVVCSCLGAAIHERAPVFSALYAWSSVPLLGLCVALCLGLLRKPVASDHPLMGHGILASALAHRRWYQSNGMDLLGDGGLVWSLRGLPVMAAWLGADWRAWPALGVAFASRLIGTDTSRFLMWAAPALILRMPDPPLWMVAIHVATFRRVVF
jgi:hypothetical protein